MLSLPALLFTLGLFLLVINAAMLGLVALLLPGFKIGGFWTAVGGVDRREPGELDRLLVHRLARPRGNHPPRSRD